MSNEINWKQQHADDSEEGVLDHPIVVSAMEEFAMNMHFKLEGLPRYGLLKIVSRAAQVARAHALGFDPELLRLSADESDEQMLELARLAVAKGMPVTKVETDGTVTRLD